MRGSVHKVDLPDPWRDLRKAVLADKRELSEAVFEQVRQVFVRFYAEDNCAVADLTPEFRHEEFLTVVNDQGAATGTQAESLKIYRETVAKHANFGRWLREARAPEGEQVLLAARWLCHLVGLRHRTVEIFIDPPHLDGHTLVQVRGMDKHEAPGAFDIPCAGHISGIDQAQAALKKELAEELGLSLDDLLGLRLLARYNSYTERPTGESMNNEYRFLYHAQLNEKSAKQIRFTDGEVAGLAVFSVPELKMLVERFPERVASGLSGAMAYYQ